MMGRSGSCKSTAILDYLVRTGLPSLYFSADTDVSDQMPREMAARSGHSVKDVTQAIDNGCEDLYEEYARTSSIEWCFESSPTVEEIFSEVQAYVEKYDAYPEIIVVDVLLNVEVGNDDNGGLRYVEKQLHRLARLTRAAVIVVHHTREVGDSRFPQAKSEIDNKVDKLLERILTVAIDRDAASRYGVAVADVQEVVQTAIGGAIMLVGVPMLILPGPGLLAIGGGAVIAGNGIKKVLGK